MPHLFRTRDGKQWRPSQPIYLTLADGTKVEGIWAGSAQEEKLAWWLRKPGNKLAQTDEVAEVGVKTDDTHEIICGVAPTSARLIFVVETSPPGKLYRLVKMVTTAANPAQMIHFRHERFALFGTLKPDGTISKFLPLQPPPTMPPAQGILF
jgi:hypothetical protein